MATANLSSVSESKNSASMLACPTLEWEPVAAFFAVLIARPMGKTVEMVFNPGFVAFIFVMAHRTLKTPGPGSSTSGYLSLGASTNA